jgi:poly(3-hydroxybutyrate) depolymerase
MKKLLLLCLPMIGFGQQTFNFMHNGLNREYIYYAPVNLPVDAPLVLWLMVLQVQLREL